MRQFSDIPYAQEVAHLIRAEEAFEELLADQQMRPADLLWYAPVFEVRYKSINQALLNTGMWQVLELASGLSLRGLSLTQEHDLLYVDTDLPELVGEKAALIAELRHESGGKPRGDMRLLPANALDGGQLRRAAQSFRTGEPVVVVSEGLFPYLTADEMGTVAENVRDLLAEFGGVWITPDFALKTDVRDVSELQRRFRQVVAAATERTMYNNAFADYSQLKAFVESLGLRVQTIKQLELVPEIVSMERLSLPAQVLEQATGGFNLWVLRLA